MCILLRLDMTSEQNQFMAIQGLRLQNKMSAFIILLPSFGTFLFLSRRTGRIFANTLKFIIDTMKPYFIQLYTVTSARNAGGALIIARVALLYWRVYLTNVTHVHVHWVYDKPLTSKMQ